MPAVFDEILDTLSDGEYHTFEEIKFKAARNLNETQVEAVLLFLDRYGFIKRRRNRWSIRTKGAKLTESMVSFLNQLKGYEGVEDKQEAPQQ